MSWARIMAPLSGGAGDPGAIAAGASLAEPFGAELAGVYTPADVADVMPWMGEGFLGGVQSTALESLKEAAAVGEVTRPAERLDQRVGLGCGRQRNSCNRGEHRGCGRRDHGHLENAISHRCR